MYVQGIWPMYQMAVPAVKSFAKGRVPRRIGQARNDAVPRDILEWKRQHFVRTIRLQNFRRGQRPRLQNAKIRGRKTRVFKHIFFVAAALFGKIWP
jgi:hypothetical protein